MTDIDYDVLRFAIIQQAVKDYESALRRRNESKFLTLERWFMSDWGQFLSGDLGEQIIEKCKERVNKNVF